MGLPNPTRIRHPWATGGLLGAVATNGDRLLLATSGKVRWQFGVGGMEQGGGIEGVPG